MIPLTVGVRHSRWADEATAPLTSLGNGHAYAVVPSGLTL